MTTHSLQSVYAGLLKGQGCSEHNNSFDSIQEPQSLMKLKLELFGTESVLLDKYVYVHF